MTNQNITPVEQLVPVFTAKIGNNNTYACNASDLHTYLECRSRFNDWIANRIEKYQFQENQDFISFTKNLVKPSGGRPSTEYHITLDMAKELAMVENNQRGREVRRYFIAMEKQAIAATHATINNAIPQNYQNSLHALAEAARISEEANKAAAEANQAAATANRILHDTALALANQYANSHSIPIPTPSQHSIKQLSDSELAFIQAWWECFGSQPVTASDLYRAVATKQCQVLNNSSDSLLGNITEWTAKKLSHALRRWSQLILDSYIVRCIGKTSHGLLWQLQLV